jgi:hypothetical protein
MNSLRSTSLLLMMLASASAAAQSPRPFTATYQGGSEASCDSTQAIRGWEPDAPGTHPVFVYMAGTWEPHDNASALAIVRRMAGRGYVAATLQYPNWTFGDCPTLSARAHCIFDEKNPRSAIQTLCARTKADCSRGIVLSGFSQGSILAILARDHDSRVRAVYGMGSGVQYAGYDLRECVTPAKRTLARDRLRVIDGERDGFLGGNERSVRGQLMELTGVTCPSPATSCAQDNTSGWYIVNHSEATDGDAEHCYMRQGGCMASSARMDPKWLEGAQPWSLDTNLQWLTTFTGP